MNAHSHIMPFRMYISHPTLTSLPDLTSPHLHLPTIIDIRMIRVVRVPMWPMHVCVCMYVCMYICMYIYLSSVPYLRNSYPCTFHGCTALQLDCNWTARTSKPTTSRCSCSCCCCCCCCCCSSYLSLPHT